MKTATVTDLRKNFHKLSGWVDAGHSVDITRRGRVFARLEAAVDSPKELVKPDFMAQLKEVWGDRVFTAAEVKEMREAELEGEEG